MCEVLNEHESRILPTVISYTKKHPANLHVVLLEVYISPLFFDSPLSNWTNLMSDGRGGKGELGKNEWYCGGSFPLGYCVLIPESNKYPPIFLRVRWRSYPLIPQHQLILYHIAPFVWRAVKIPLHSEILTCERFVCGAFRLQFGDNVHGRCHSIWERTEHVDTGRMVNSAYIDEWT